MSSVQKMDSRYLILIVEDSHTQRDVLQNMLENQDFQVEAAANGQEALALLKRMRPMTVISDIVMPEVDGYELCRRMKADHELQNIPVILLTSLSDPEDVIMGLECGADYFIMKPYDEKFLLSRIQHILANRNLETDHSVRMGLEIFFRGKKYFINSDRLQILNLLLSTYETAIQKNQELAEATAELEELNEELEVLNVELGELNEELEAQSENLEQQVQERTQDLEKVIAELKSTQRQVIQQEKLAMIGQLTAGIAHEINTPISYISSNIESLASYFEIFQKYMGAQQEALLSNNINPQQLEQLQELNCQLKVDRIGKAIPEMIKETIDGAEILKSIIVGLKGFSHIDESDQTFADINKCLEDSLNIAHNELKYKATITLDYGELPQIWCHPRQLVQVFINLLVNAAQAIADSGEITIRTRQAENDILVTISDTGCGIPEEFRTLVFEPFFTTKAAGKGTGLGLSISNEIIRNHGGKIDVESKEGHGSTFIITLPLDYAGSDTNCTT